MPVRVSQQFLKARADLITALDSERISWVDPIRYHITIRFIGRTEGPDIPKISIALQRYIAVPKKQTIGLEELGIFGSKKNPRVIWLATNGMPFFENIKNETELVLKSCNLSLEEQQFRPHLTLGRVRRTEDPERFHRIIKNMKDRFREHILLDRLVFYRSEHGSTGPVYTPLEQIQFRS